MVDGVSVIMTAEEDAEQRARWAIEAAEPKEVYVDVVDEIKQLKTRMTETEVENTTLKVRITEAETEIITLKTK